MAWLRWAGQEVWQLHPTSQHFHQSQKENVICQSLDRKCLLIISHEELDINLVGGNLGILQLEISESKGVDYL